MGWICPDCDNVNLDNSSVCECGYNSDENETQDYLNNSDLPKINRLKKGCLATFILFILAILFLFYKGCTINLPVIEGTVIYEETNTPVEYAYVICFYYKYPLIEAINVGGANSDFNYVDVVKTNKDGKFILGPYQTISLNLDDTREFFIYKPGYSVLRYFQASAFSFIDMNNYPWMPKVAPRKKFLLPKEFNNENNNIFSLQGNIENFVRYFKHNDSEKYDKNLKIFREIYKHIKNDSAQVKTMIQDEYSRESWDRDMKDLRHLLDIKD